MCKKIASIVVNILLYIFIAVCIFALGLSIFSKKDVDGTAELFGYQMRIVASDSMGSCEFTDVSDYDIGSIPVRSLVFVKTMPKDVNEADDWYRSLKVGDVLTFKYVYKTQVTITHRITSITEKETGGFIIELEGDNKNSDSKLLTQTIDTSIPNNTNYVIGKVVGQAYLLGLIVSLLMEPLGIVLIVILPCLIIIFLEVIKIAKLFAAEKKRIADEQIAEKEKELAELRDRLAKLESNNNSDTDKEKE